MCEHEEVCAQIPPPRAVTYGGEGSLAPSAPEVPEVCYLLDVHSSPPGLVLRDWPSRQPLAQLDEALTRRLFRLKQQGGAPAMAELVDLFACLSGPAAESSSDVEGEYQEETEEPAQGIRKTRYKLWELPQQLHCPIIGTCLEVAELHRLARRLKAPVQALSDYQVHLGFVSGAGSKNHLSVAAHKALDRKHAAHLRRFAGARDRARLTACWEDALSRGEVPGGFWALLTHPHCDGALRERAREAVHMLSHQIGAGQRADLQRLAQAESALGRLQRDFEAQASRTRSQLEDREQRILELERQLATLQQAQRRTQAAEHSLRQRLTTLQAGAGPQRLAELQLRLERDNRRLHHAEEQAQHWRAACRNLGQRLDRLQAECRAKQEEYTTLERLCISPVNTCEECPEGICRSEPDLCGRRILCVGGRNQHLGQYRALVSRCNGRFDHHDGGREDNRQRLEAMLGSADAVVCATDCVSHDAYQRLKRFCKRHHKPYFLLRSSGLGCFAQALMGIAD